jgi:anti-anti-sigma factor
VPEDPCPVRWTGQQALVTLPPHIDVSNVGPVREQLLGLVNRGASVLIADMTDTLSCDHAGADALGRVYQRASVNNTRLRVVVTTRAVRRVLDATGLDRQISIYPSVEAAVAAGVPARVTPVTSGPAKVHDDDRADGSPGVSRSGAISSAVLLALVDALADGVVLTHGDGVIALANRRAEDMFGYSNGELTGRSIESLIPTDLRVAHVSYRAGYDLDPVSRPMGARSRLVGLRKDGSTLPVWISLSPVPTANGRFTLVVIRDASEAEPSTDLGELARAAATDQHAHLPQNLLDRVVNGLFQVGLSLRTAIELPHDVARQQIADALRRLDDTIREIHNHTFDTRRPAGPADSAPPNGTG